MLATLASTSAAAPLIEDPAAILAVLLGVLAIIFAFGETGVGRRIFGIVPKLVFCYFIPTTLTTCGILPADSELYTWIKVYLLPASLLLLVLALDVPGILRLGPRAVAMLLAGTTGVVIGGPLALLLCRGLLPEEMLDQIWRGLAALSGSWIGGGANMVALKQMAECNADMFAKMVIVDVFVANVWMGVLLYAAGMQQRIDRWTGADTGAIEDLKHRMADFEARTTRVPTLPELMVIVAVAFVGAVLCLYVGQQMNAWMPFFSATTWKFILITSGGMVLSFTPARKLDGAGASKIGSVMLYLLVASIGAHADFTQIGDAPVLVLVGFVWMACHVIVLLGTAWLIRAPIFFVAVGSQANIGGAASAPVVAAAYHPSLAPVGVLLAVAGYVLGTYAGLACMFMLRLVANG